MKKKDKDERGGAGFMLCCCSLSHVVIAQSWPLHCVGLTLPLPWGRQPMLVIWMISGPINSPCSLIKPQRKRYHFPAISEDQCILLSTLFTAASALLLIHAIRHSQGWRFPLRSSNHLLYPWSPAGTTCATSPQPSVHISRLRERLQSEEGLCTFRHFSLEWTQITPLSFPLSGPGSDLQEPMELFCALDFRTAPEMSEAFDGVTTTSSPQIKSSRSCLMYPFLYSQIHSTHVHGASMYQVLAGCPMSQV